MLRLHDRGNYRQAHITLREPRMTKSLQIKTHEHWKHPLTGYRFLPLILILSLALNIWGNRWGAPNFWHPDEVTSWTISMVENRTLNPHYFPYGGMHYYVVAVGAFIPVKLYEKSFDPSPSQNDTRLFTQWYDRHQGRIIQMARTLSALMATVVVWFTFMMGTILFDKRVGYLSALLLAVSMSFVGIAHFATVDTPANLWYWLSCLFALLIWKRGDQLWYVLAAISAGFAIGTKIDRVIILIPLVLSHCLHGEGLRYRKVLLFVVLVPAGYLVANPVVFLSLFEFLDGFTRELFFNTFREDPSEGPSYLRMLGHTKAGLGLPLCVTALSGLAYGLWNLAQGKNTARIIWLLATFVPYYILFSLNFSMPWYVVFIFPPLMIFAAYGCVGVMDAVPERKRFAIKAMVSVIVGYSFLNSMGLVLQFSYDARYQAADWIEQHVPADATIEMTPWGPVVRKERYRVIEQYPVEEGWSDSWIGRAVHELESDPTYQRLRSGILSLEKWAGQALGLPVREQGFMGWFDWERKISEKSSNQLGGLVRVQGHQAEYVVLIEYLLGKRLSMLQSQNSGYRLVAQFEFSNPLGVQPSFVFVNPRVYIFQLEASAS